MSGNRLGRDAVCFWPWELQVLVQKLLDARWAGRLGDAETMEVARFLIAGDGAGRLWTVGLRTGKFYRWDGTRWVQDDPRGKLLIVAPAGVEARVPIPAGQARPTAPE